MTGERETLYAADGLTWADQYEALAVTVITYAGIHNNPWLMALVHDQQTTTYGLPDCDCEWCVRAAMPTKGMGL